MSTVETQVTVNLPDGSKRSLDSGGRTQNYRYGGDI